MHILQNKKYSKIIWIHTIILALYIHTHFSKYLIFLLNCINRRKKYILKISLSIFVMIFNVYIQII